MELYLVPDVREKRPGIVVNEFVEHLFIRELDQPPAGMIAREILAAEFPQRGVEVTDIDHITGRVGYFDPVAHAIRLTHQDVNPRDEAFHRSLHSQPDDDRTDTERSDRGVPIHKNNRDNNNRDGQRNSQPLDALEGETGGSIFDPANSIE